MKETIEILYELIIHNLKGETLIKVLYDFQALLKEVRLNESHLNEEKKS